MNALWLDNMLCSACKKPKLIWLIYIDNNNNVHVLVQKTRIILWFGFESVDSQIQNCEKIILILEPVEWRFIQTWLLINVMLNIEGPQILSKREEYYNTDIYPVTIHRKKTSTKVIWLNLPWGSKCHFERNYEPIMKEKEKITSHVKYYTTVWFPF